MPVKHCCYGNCNNDSRYAAVRPEMNDVFFIPFPKPKTQRAKCERWVWLCSRKYFGVDNVNKDTYMCSKHFVGGNGPSIDHLDPLPVSATDYKVRVLSSKRKRKSPAQRSTLSFSRSRRTIKPLPNPEEVHVEVGGWRNCYLLWKQWFLY